MKKFISLFLLFSSLAGAAPSFSEMSVSGTSTRTSVQDPGYLYLTCSQDVHVVAGTSPTATVTDALIKAGGTVPVAVSDGQKVAVITNGGPGRCYLNRFDGQESGSDQTFDDVTIDDLTAARATVTDAGVTRLSAQSATIVDAGITRAQIATLDGVNLNATSIDAGFNKITVAECTGCGSFTGGGVPNATTFGSEVSAPKFDGGSYVGTTLNLSGAAVVGGNLSATAGKSYFGNIDLDGGARLCTNAACTNYIGTNSGIIVGVSGAGEGFQFSGGPLVTNGTHIYSYYNLGVGLGWGGVTSGAGTLIQATGTGRENTAHCDTRATSTSYPQVCNQVSGKARIANGAGAASFDINNGLMLNAAGSCRAWFSNVDATCTSITCAADAGNMTFDVNANCTAATDFDWAMESRN